MPGAYFFFFFMGRAAKLPLVPIFPSGKGNSRSSSPWEKFLIKQPWKLIDLIALKELFPLFCRK